MTPGHLPLAGDRYTPFVRTLQFNELDLTGAVFAMQVRDRKDGGALRADLATVVSSTAQGVRLVYGGTDTVANHLTAGRITETPEGYASDDDLALSLVALRINETTMEAMPFGTPDIGDNDAELWWDLHITPDDGIKQVYLQGKFTVRAGTTI